MVFIPYLSIFAGLGQQLSAQLMRLGGPKFAAGTPAFSAASKAHPKIPRLEMVRREALGGAMA
jgi:hypothetical protein